MKNRVFFFFFLCLSCFSYSQKTAYDFLDSSFVHCDSSKAVYKREIQKYVSEEAFYVKVFTIKKKVQVMEGRYLSLFPEIEDGKFTFYIPQQKARYEGHYSLGRMAGIWKKFNKRHKLKKEYNYDIDTSSTEVINRQPKLVVDSLKSILEEVPSFNTENSIKDFQKYIKERFLYPPMAFLKRKEGKAYISFIVDEDGALSNFKIVRSSYKDLGWEAIRILNSMPAWKPGKMNGKPIPVKMTFPITFTI